MKICYFHQHFSTPIGSTGIRSYKMAKELLRQGHQVTMVCGSYDVSNTGIDSDFVNGVRRGNFEGIDIVEFELPYSNSKTFLGRTLVFLMFSIRSVLFVLKNRHDIVFCTSTPLTAAIPGIFAKIFKSEKFVFEVRDLWPELPKAMGVIKNPIVLWLLKILEKISYKCADRVVALSDGMKHGIASVGTPLTKISSIPNGCDFDFVSNNSCWFRDTYSIGRDKFVAIFAGTHGLANGLDVLIDTAVFLKQADVRDIHIVLIGKGACKKELVGRAVELNLYNISFIDPIGKSELFEVFNECDVGLQILANVPEFYNGTSPNKFFDYLAAGLPIVSNYPGWLSDVIVENRCGMVAHADSPSDLANVLIEMKNNRTSLHDMSLNSKRVASELFSRDMLARKWVDWVVEGKC